MIKWLAVAFLAFTGPSSAAVTPPPVPQHLVDYACEYIEVFEGGECSDIAPPLLLWSEMRNFFGTAEKTLYGRYYYGSAYIQVNVEYQDSSLAATIMVHETAHYLAHEMKLGLTKCESEDLARRIHHLYEGSVYDPEWKVRYKCA